MSMPELPEGVNLTEQFIFDQPAGFLGVKIIQADATIEESLSYPPGSRANLGHVYTLESSSTILRVSCDSQTPVYPPLYATDPDDPPVPISERGLVLLEAETHPRNILLKFCDGESQTYWCQVQFLKHTVSQEFNKLDWDEVICMDNVVERVTDRRTRQSNRASNAMTLVRNSSEIFAGAGVYTISELWHMAGLSPYLTEAEVFDSPSQTARLCGAFYHFAKKAHTTLWTVVQRFLVDIERLHVYGKECSYVSARLHGLLVNFKVKKCTATGPFDVFEPELIRHALECEDIKLGNLIFGEELWTKLHFDAAPIPRARPPRTPKMEQIEEAVAPGKKGKVQKPPRPKPVHLLFRNPPLCNNAIPLLAMNFTVGPLDYCGIARRTKGRGDDVVMYYPRLPHFYHHRYALGVATAKLKSRGKEKKGLATNTLAAVKGQVAKMQPNIQSTVEKENATDLEIGIWWRQV
ncbi:hypothetical protein B0H13DRAFT_1889078 [Mycena leptocephala]|nr:hypothetical protein B0H13DRAFT_1889078 [Mycena leptocephala]